MAFAFYAMYEAPMQIPVPPHLWGQHALNFMLYTRIGLLLVGSTMVIAAASGGASMLFYLLLPLAAIKHALAARRLH